MQRLNVAVSDEIYKIVQSIPKANRGQLVNASIEYFMRSEDGQKILTFLTSNQMPKTDLLTLLGTALKDSENSLSAVVSGINIPTNANNSDIDTSDWNIK